MSKSSKTQRQGFRKEFRKQSKIYVKRQNVIIVMKSDRDRLVEQLEEIAEIRLMARHWSIRWMHRLSFWFWKEAAKARLSFRAMFVQLRKGRG